MEKSTFLITSIILVLLLTSILSFGTNIRTVLAETYFNDNFDDGVANGWTQQLGSWAVTNGEYSISLGIVENGISTVADSSLADCTIETKLRFTDSVGFRGGIVFRYMDNEHYYSFELSNNYDTRP